MQKYIYEPFALGKIGCVLGEESSGNDNLAGLALCRVRSFTQNEADSIVLYGCVRVV